MKCIFFVFAAAVFFSACTNAGKGSDNPVDSMNRSGAADTAKASMNGGNGRDTMPVGDSAVHNR